MGIQMGENCCHFLSYLTQTGNAMGYKIIAVDARDEALELCKKAGAETVLDAREGKEAVVKQVKEITGEGCHATINLSEHETAAPLACAITRMHQKMIQISQPDIVSKYLNECGGLN